MRKILFILLMIAGLVGTISAQNLIEGKWRLTSYNFKQKIAFPIDKTEITMNIHSAKLGGKSGCNIYGAGYTLKNGKLKISDLISTMMACQEPSMQFERSFADTLLGVSRYKLKDGFLTLTDPKTANFLRFERADKPAAGLRVRGNR